MKLGGYGLTIQRFLLLSNCAILVYAPRKEQLQLPRKTSNTNGAY